MCFLHWRIWLQCRGLGIFSLLDLYFLPFSSVFCFSVPADTYPHRGGEEKPSSVCQQSARNYGSVSSNWPSTDIPLCIVQAHSTTKCNREARVHASTSNEHSVKHIKCLWVDEAVVLEKAWVVDSMQFNGHNIITTLVYDEFAYCLIFVYLPAGLLCPALYKHHEHLNWLLSAQTACFQSFGSSSDRPHIWRLPPDDLSWWANAAHGGRPGWVHQN